MSLKNIKSNLSPKARIVLLSVGLVAVGSVWIMYQAFSSDGPEIPDGVAGAVKINNDNDTVKDRGDKQDLLPKDSVAQKEIDALEKKEKEDKKQKGSFMDQLELNNDTKVLTEIEKNLGNRHVETGVDDVSDKLNERQVKAQDLLNRQRRAKNNIDNANTTDNGGQQTRVQNTAYIPIPFDEKSFMDTEKNRIAKHTNSIESYAKGINYKTTSTVGKGGIQNNAISKNADSSETPTGQTDYSSFIRKPNEFPKTDSSQLDKFRNLARGSMGSDAPPQVSNNEQNYQDVVYPAGAPIFDVEEKIMPGDMYYAMLEIEVNTDEISPVRATIVQEGPLKGGVLIGMPKRVGGKSMIEFSTLALKGQTYSGVSVVAVDPDTMRTAFADDVDYHTFERYFKLAAASIVAGYAEALTSVEKQTSATGTETEVSVALPKFSDRMAVAIGRVGEKLEPVYAKEFERAPTVTIYKNRDLGIMFLSELIINGENK
jgi:hypothetical protein